MYKSMYMARQSFVDDAVVCVVNNSLEPAV